MTHIKYGLIIYNYLIKVKILKVKHGVNSMTCLLVRIGQTIFEGFPIRVTLQASLLLVPCPYCRVGGGGLRGLAENQVASVEEV